MPIKAISIVLPILMVMAGCMQREYANLILVPPSSEAGVSASIPESEVQKAFSIAESILLSHRMVPAGKQHPREKCYRSMNRKEQFPFGTVCHVLYGGGDGNLHVLISEWEVYALSDEAKALHVAIYKAFVETFGKERIHIQRSKQIAPDRFR